MGDAFLALDGVGTVLTSAEEEVAPHGERTSAESGGEPRRAAVGVHAHTAEVGPEAGLEVGTQRRVERRAPSGVTADAGGDRVGARGRRRGRRGWWRRPDHGRAPVHRARGFHRRSLVRSGLTGPKCADRGRARGGRASGGKRVAATTVRLVQLARAHRHRRRRRRRASRRCRRDRGRWKRRGFGLGVRTTVHAQCADHRAASASLARWPSTSTTGRGAPRSIVGSTATTPRPSVL